MDCSKETDECVAINWSKKKCFFLSKTSTLSKKKGWAAGVCVEEISPSTTLTSTSEPSTEPPTEPPSGPPTKPPTEAPTEPPSVTLMKNKFFTSKKDAFLEAKPFKTKTAEDCVEKCEVEIVTK